MLKYLLTSAGFFGSDNEVILNKGQGASDQVLSLEIFINGKQNIHCY